MSNVSKEIDEGALEDCYRTYIVTKPSVPYIVNSIFGCIVNLVLFFVGTFLNAVVICVFWKSRRLRYKISYFMIMVLSTIDLLVTLIVHPSHLIMSISEIVGKPRCAYKAFYHETAVVLSGMSSCTFFVMNIERYVSIVHPVFHLVHVTKLRCLGVCSMFWAMIIFIGVACLLNWDIELFITILVLIIVLGTCYIYLVIFYTARKKKRSQQKVKRCVDQNKFSGPADDRTLSDNYGNTLDAMYTSMVQLSGKPFTVMTPGDLNRQNQSSNMDNEGTSERDKTKENVKSHKTVSFLHDLQLAKMYFLVVSTNVVLNLPYAITLSVFPDEGANTVNALIQSKIWIVTLVTMNSTVNCLIFFWANKKLRKEGWKVCKGFFKH